MIYKLVDFFFSIKYMWYLGGFHYLIFESALQEKKDNSIMAEHKCFVNMLKGTNLISKRCYLTIKHAPFFPLRIFCALFGMINQKFFMWEK